MKKTLSLLLIIAASFFYNIVLAQQQELYTFCTGGSYAYLFDTSATSSSGYYGRWNIGSTGYTAHMQKDTIYKSLTGGGGGGGSHGGVAKYACTSTTTYTTAWSYSISSGAHHDICPLPNGNVLVIVDETKTASQISAAGGTYSSSISSPMIEEIHPTGSTTGTIVWQWKLWDHICQNTNSSITSTYVSSISQNPQLFDLALIDSQDFFHMNGIDYNPTLNQIVVSSHFMNEVYVIDHSTTTAQAATHAGGNAGKGGDFLYRWGSPQNYGCTSNGNGITLNVIHDARWVPSTNQDYPGYISIFHNGGCSSGKGIVLFLPPYNGYNYTYTPGSVIGPTTCTTPTTPSFSVSNQGGAMACENGNILITNPGSKFYECSGTGTTYQQITIGTIQSDRLKKCEVLGPFPTASSSTSSVCVGTAFTLNSSATAPLQTSPSYTYSWSSNPTGFTSTQQNPSVTPSSAGSYIYTVTVTSGGCSNTASVTVTQNALPTANAGNDVTIAQGNSTTLTATGGGTYAWSNGGNTASTTVSPTTTTTYTVTVTSTYGCTASDNVVVTVTAGTLSVTTSATPSAICSGSSTLLYADPTGGSSYTYSWASNPSGFSSTSQNPTVSPTTTTTYTVTVTSSGNTVSSNVVVTVYPLPTANAGIDASICSGNSTTLTASGGTSYSWNTGGTTASISVTPTSTTSYTVTVTDANSCTDSDDVTVTVTSTVAASCSISANPSGGICVGTSVTFTATATNGGSSPTYQWKKNGSNISGATNSTYISSSLANGDIITCELTSNLGCVSGSPATSNAITMTVNSSLPASVSISANPSGSICAGTSVTFTASPTNGGTPAYQWMLNGSNISGETNSTYTSSTLTDGNIITCSMTSSLSCSTGSPATSNAITISISSALPASISISSNPSGAICSGTSVTFTATATNGGSSPSYQWQLNGSNVGPNSSTVTTSALANGDVITCIMTSSLSCVTGSPATSNSITMVVNASSPASVSISAVPGTEICTGTSVTFTASPTNGGTSPAYQWYLNGSPITGATNSSYTSSSLSNNDNIYCVMTSNANCVSGSPATSNTLTVTISASVVASVVISVSPSNSICSGSTAAFTATAMNGGLSPSYQWQLNGSNAGANSSIYTPSSISNGDVIKCIMTSSNTCATNNPATSDTITMSVQNLLPVSLTITSYPDSICEGESVTFSAYPVNGGTSPTYQWQVNGVNAGTSSTLFTTSSIISGDGVSCILTSSITCPSGNPATSNTIYPFLYPTPPTPVITNINDTLYSDATSGNQWYFQNLAGNMPISGAIVQMYVPIITGDYFVVVTNQWGCVSDTSNVISLNIAGIPEHNDDAFYVYPNPTTGMIYFDNNNHFNFVVRIYNTLGELLIEKENISSLDISSFDNGTYYISFIKNDAYSKIGKIILLK